MVVKIFFRLTLGLILMSSFLVGGAKLIRLYDSELTFFTYEGSGSNIYEMDTARNLTIMLARFSDDLISKIAWSPHGKQLALASNHGIYGMDANGHNIHLLTQESSSHAAIAWSPDETRIAFDSFLRTSQIIYVVNLKSGDMQNISKGFTMAFFDGWSANGEHIGFETYSKSGPNGFFLVDPNGDHLQPLLESDISDIYGFSRSPDGEELVFTRRIEGSTKRDLIYVMDAYGNHQHVIASTFTPLPFGTRWSPDNSRIAFYAEGAVSGLFISPISGAEQPHLILPSSSMLFVVGWSPDNSQIAFISGVNSEFFGLVNEDGSNPRIFQGTYGHYWSLIWRPQ